MVRTTINEEARLNALRDLRLLDTPPSESFDRLTRLASKLLGAPVSTISLTDRDRQWFKSKVGVELAEIPREQAPCSYAIEGDDVFVVPDLAADPRFEGSPLVQAGIRFYAGAPLFTRSGHGLGTLCVVDSEVRDIADEERRVLRDLADMVMSQVELQNMIGRIDATTGLPNQHQLFEDLEDIARAAPGRLCLGLLVDVVSARAQGQRVMGTEYQEAMLQAAIGRLQTRFNHVRIFHVSTTRLALLVEEDLNGATAFGGLVRDTLAQPVEFNGVPMNICPVIGTFEFAAGDLLPRDVLRRLINALEDAYDQEGAIAGYSAAHDLRHAREFMLLNDFAAALASDDQLSLAYQPRVDMKSGTCPSVEALMRWTHPQLGSIPPMDFIPAVEQTALARPMTEWVIRTGLAQLVAWNRSGIEIALSVNVSAQNLDEPDFADRVLGMIAAAGVRPDRLELEFTESAVSRDSQRAFAQLSLLRAHGLAVAIDDFGTGFSNLSYLQQLPGSVLKIDRGFVSGIAGSGRDQTLVRAIIAMAHDLGYRVVAEGIETDAVFDMLRDWGCDEGQGYLMARPMQAAALAEWLRSQSAQALSA